MATRRIMKEFSIFEISGVDAPAQAPALMTLMKAKNLSNNAGEPGAGHKKEDNMSKTAEELTAELAKQAELTKAADARADRAELIAKMSDEEKKAFGDIKDEKEKESFLAAKPEDRKKEVAKRAEADPVIYKSKATGAEYRKSDDTRLVDLAKRDDEREAEIAKMRGDALDEVFTKRASTELAKFKGEVSDKALLLKAVASIKDDAGRTRVSDMLKAVHGALGVMLKEVGTSNDLGDDGGPDADLKKTAEDGLDKLAKAYAEKHSVTFAKAYDAVLSTTEGAKLYAKAAG